MDSDAAFLDTDGTATETDGLMVGGQIVSSWCGDIVLTHNERRTQRGATQGWPLS